jgi:predicted nucleic acid-binding protein
VKPENTKKYVIDASVAVKWFSIEDGTEKARKVLSQAYEGKAELYAPDILVYEVANALWKGKKYPKEDVQDALETIYDSPMQLLAPDKLLAFSSIQFMANYNLSFYDAVYAGLASILQIPLLTANPKDHARVKEIEQVKL